MIVDLEASSAEDAVALKEKITDKLHNFIVAENYEAIFSISIGVIDAATFCEGTEAVSYTHLICNIDKKHE